MTITQQRLRDLLDYDPNTGAFHWKARRGGRALAGAVAGTRCSDGYLKIRIERQPYQAHRLAWLHAFGEWPQRQIDHINCDRADNRICNLRLVTNGENQQNALAPKRHNRSGYRGVTFHPQSGKFRARLTADGRTVDCGLHATAELAHQAYVEAKARHHIPHEQRAAK